MASRNSLFASLLLLFSRRRHAASTAETNALISSSEAVDAVGDAMSFESVVDMQDTSAKLSQRKMSVMIVKEY